MIERVHLAVVREVHKLRSMTAAAAALSVTQSALSHSMKKLEQQLGTDIWVREGRAYVQHKQVNTCWQWQTECSPNSTWQKSGYASSRKASAARCASAWSAIPATSGSKVVSPYLAAWPDVDVDVKHRFQFGGIGALFGFEIDQLVTPDPLFKPGIKFEPVLYYEQYGGRPRACPCSREVRQSQNSSSARCSRPIPLRPIGWMSTTSFFAGRSHAEKA